MANNENRSLKYDEIVRLTEKNEIILLDVREPAEIQETGKIPNSHLIPLGEVKSALELPESEFENRYGLPKPNLDAPLVFSCRTDRRSRLAMDAALQMGFDKSRFYEGGYLDWVKHSNS